MAFFCREELSQYYSKADTGVFLLRKELEKLFLACWGHTATQTDAQRFDQIVKTFEVRKRLYHCYTEKMKPCDERDFEDLTLYILFSATALLFYRKNQDLKYLSALLKVNDILLSLYEKISEEFRQFLAFCIQGELNCVEDLIKECCDP